MSEVKPQCVGVGKSGERCRITTNLSPEGLCAVHVPGGVERMREMASRGGSRRGKTTLASADITSPQQAKAQLDLIRKLTLAGKITPQQSTAASRAIEQWLRADAQQATKRLVDEINADLARAKDEIKAAVDTNRTLTRESDKLKAENAQLRAQILELRKPRVA